MQPERVGAQPPHQPLLYRLRLLSAVGIAGVVAGVLVQLVGEYLGPRVPAAMAANQVMTLPIAWVPLAALLMAVAWSYILVGALHAPVWLRFTIGIAWALLAWPFVEVGGLWAAPGAVAVLLLLLWRNWARPLLDFGWRESMVFAVAVAATLVGALVASLREPMLPLLSFITALSSQLTVFTIVATPLLILGGLDLAEVAGGLGGWIARHTERWRPQYLALLVGALALLQVAYFFVGGLPVTPGAGLTLVALAALLWFGGRISGGAHLVEPPFPLLVSLLLLTLAAPLGGVLITMAGGEVPILGFLGSALFAVLASLLLRRWIDRRWPGAGAALFVVALWLSWLVTGGTLSEWAPSSRVLQVGIALTALLLAALASRSPAFAQRLPLALEALIVTLAMGGIEAAYDRDIDAGDIFTFIQVTALIGSSLWLLLRRQGLRLLLLLGGFAALVLVVLLKPSLLDATQGITNLALMGLALIWSIILAHKRMGELIGAGQLQVHLTFLLIGFSLLTVAVLGWNRSLRPLPEGLTDFGFLAQFGLVALGLPLYLLRVSQRARG